MQKFIHGPHGTSQSVSIYDEPEEEVKAAPSKTSLNKKKSQTKFRHSGDADDPNRIHIQSSHTVEPGRTISALQKELTGDVCTFEDHLKASPSVLISTQIRTIAEDSKHGKRGYEISTSTGTSIGFLIPELQTNWLDKLCCTTTPKENDPFSYNIIAPNGKDIFSIYGLDEEVATENTVQITRAKVPLGTVNYSHHGTDEVHDVMSKVTSMAGRGKNYMVPTSVIDSGGNLLYIFRSFPIDSVENTELLTVDGHASTVAEIIKEKVKLKKNEGPGQKTKVFSVHFLMEMPPENKSLVLSVAVTIMNRWIRKHNERQPCCGKKPKK